MFAPGNREDAAVVEFALKWLPYGGASPAEILVEFGMTPARFIERLRDALTTAAFALDAGERGAITAFADARLPHRQTGQHR